MSPNSSVSTQSWVLITNEVSPIPAIEEKIATYMSVFLALLQISLDNISFLPYLNSRRQKTDEITAFQCCLSQCSHRVRVTHCLKLSAAPVAPARNVLLRLNNSRVRT